jgi:hypothetical protein
MRKIVRLTESDLVRLVKRVINEQTVTGSTGNNTSVNTKLPPQCGTRGIEKMKLALNSGYLQKIEFDYKNNVAFFTTSDGGRECGVKINEFRGMF